MGRFKKVLVEGYFSLAPHLEHFLRNLIFFVLHAGHFFLVIANNTSTTSKTMMIIGK
jgi:hypothetical protein